MKRSVELKDLTLGQAYLVALVAKAARAKRDALLGSVDEEKLGEPRPSRGMRNPAETLGFDPVPAGAPEMVALREAVGDLSDAARAELYTLMRTGQGHLAARKWYTGLAETGMLDKDAITAAIVEDVDLHDHITKGLYEIGLSLS
jgi:hypothetical protein